MFYFPFLKKCAEKNRHSFEASSQENVMGKSFLYLELWLHGFVCFRMFKCFEILLRCGFDCQIGRKRMSIITWVRNIRNTLHFWTWIRKIRNALYLWIICESFHFQAFFTPDVFATAFLLYALIYVLEIYHICEWWCKWCHGIMQTQCNLTTER